MFQFINVLYIAILHCHEILHKGKINIALKSQQQCTKYDTKQQHKDLCGYSFMTCDIYIQNCEQFAMTAVVDGDNCQTTYQIPFKVTNVCVCHM